MVDHYNCPKRGYLECIIFVSGGLRSRYPLIRLNGKLIEMMYAMKYFQGLKFEEKKIVKIGGRIGLVLICKIV